MPPDLTSSTYKRYKADTVAFATWLRRASILCGHRPWASSRQVSNFTTNHQPVATRQSAEPAAPAAAAQPRRAVVVKKKATTRTKDKHAEHAARVAGTKTSEAKPAATTAAAAPPASAPPPAPKKRVYEVSTREMLEQITRVSGAEGEVKMPFVIRRTLDRAIKTRERFASWFAQAKANNNGFDNRGHTYFIEVLCKAQNLPVEPRNDPLGAVHPQGAPLPTSIPQASSAAVSQKGFTCLPVEDIGDEEWDSVTAAEAAKLVDSASGKSEDDAQQEDADDDDVVTVPEMEAQEQYEKTFAVFCFFQDLHRFRRGISQLWKDCCRGKVSLPAATATIYAAVSVIRQSERLICERVLGPEAKAEDCYMALSGELVDQDELRKKMGGNLEHSEAETELGVTSHEDFIMEPVALILNKLKHFKIDDRTWPHEVPALTPWAPDEAVTPRDVMLKDDDRRLTQLFLEFQYPNHMQSEPGAQGKFTWIFLQEDALLRELHAVWQRRKLSVTSVLAAQVLLDLVRIGEEEEEEGAQPFFRRQLAVACSHAIGSSTWNENLPGFQAVAKEANALYRVMKAVDEPRLPALKIAVLNAYRVDPRALHDVVRASNSAEEPDKQVTYFRLNRAPEFALDNLPLMAGSAFLKLLFEQRRLGMALANENMSILLAAYLYNAIRRLRLLACDWPLMDRIIELHRQAIFADAKEVPLTPEKMSGLLNLRLGPRLDKKNKNKNKNKSPVDQQERSVLRDTPEVDALVKLLECDPDSERRALWLVQQHILRPFADCQGGAGDYGDGSDDDDDDNEADGPGGDASTSGGAAEGTRQREQGRTTELAAGPGVCPEKLLRDLADAFSHALDKMSIDYLGLGKVCNDFLRDVNNYWPQEDPDARRDGKKEYHGVTTVPAVLKQAVRTRASKEFSYRAGEGGDARGSVGEDKDFDNPGRYGPGLHCVALLLWPRLQLRPHGESNPQFPLSVGGGDREALLRLVPDDPALTCPLFTRLQPRLVQTPTSEAEFDRLLDGSAYVAVEFYSRKDRGTRAHHLFACLAMQLSIPDFLRFVSVEVVAGGGGGKMLATARRYCATSDGADSDWGGKHTLVFFKNKSHVSVDDQTRVYASDRAAFMSTVRSVGDLARREAALRRQTPPSDTSSATLRKQADADKYWESLGDSYAQAWDY